MRRWLGSTAACVIAVAACSSSDPAATSNDSQITRSISTIERTPSTTAALTDRSADPPSAPTDPTMTPQGFERVAAIATTADGQVCELCLWLAETPEQRALGLMFATDLGDADGMAFRYPRPHTGSFWMKDTVLPLSIAFFDAGGTYIDEFDMEPCTTPTCPRYRTPGNFLVAVETTRGGLPAIGIDVGSTLVVSDLPCP